MKMKVLYTIKRPIIFLRNIYKIAKISSKNYIFIISDVIKLNKQKGLTTEEYFQFEFERRDKDFRDSFLGLNEQRYYLDYLNPKKYYILARNKYLTHKVLNNTGVRKSELYCYYHPEGKVLHSSEIANNLEGIVRILKSKEIDQCVIKTTESSSGANVLVVKKISYSDNNCILTLFDGTVKKMSDFISDTPLIFESLIAQTEQLSSLNPSSVNTIRFMTTLYPSGESKVIAAFIKIGRDGKCVDNAGKGGNVDACIDINTGKILYTIQFDGWRRIKNITHHPDNGNLIEGIKIEGWEKIKDQVNKFQESFPFIKAAGWDIAVTDEGPVVIEVNDMWDRTGQYFIRRGWRNEIRDCYFAWKKTGVKYNSGRLNNNFSVIKMNKIINKDNSNK